MCCYELKRSTLAVWFLYDCTFNMSVNFGLLCLSKTVSFICSDVTCVIDDIAIPSRRGWIKKRDKSVLIFLMDQERHSFHKPTL